jgi:hypothetical protein
VTTPARTAEHDAFGPWIDTVRTTDEVPRLFRPHGVDPFAARLVLKVPRDIPRRDTDPSMDLYEHLLVVGDRELEVLSRDGSGYGVRRIPFADLVAVRDRVDLLDGLLTLHAADGAELRIPFNGASADVVVELTELLVGLAGAAGGIPDGSPARAEAVAPRVDLGADEAGVASAYFDLAARDPQLRYLSSRPRGSSRSTCRRRRPAAPPAPDEPGRRRRRVHAPRAADPHPPRRRPPPPHRHALHRPAPDPPPRHLVHHRGAAPELGRHVDRDDPRGRGLLRARRGLRARPRGRPRHGRQLSRPGPRPGGAARADGRPDRP